MRHGTDDSIIICSKMPKYNGKWRYSIPRDAITDIFCEVVSLYFRSFFLNFFIYFSFLKWASLFP